MNQTLENLNEIEIDEVLADAGYSSGESLQYCEDRNIDAYIPNFGQYKSEREGFIYNEKENRYKCIKEGGNKAFLPFKRILTDSKGYQKKSYRSSEKDCGKCPLRAECCGKVTKFKKIEDSIHKPFYDQMHEKLNRDKNYTRFLTKRRSSTVEPVLGTLINHHNMKRINSRGMPQANKHVLMAALTYNLKKYLRFVLKKPVPIVQVVSLKQGKPALYSKRSLMTLKTQFEATRTSELCYPLKKIGSLKSLLKRSFFFDSGKLACENTGCATVTFIASGYYCLSVFSNQLNTFKCCIPFRLCVNPSVVSKYLG